MQICIWYKILKKPWGGSNSFLSTLSKELSTQGHTVTYKPSINDDVILVNSWSRGSGKYLNSTHVNQVKYFGKISSFNSLKLLPFSTKNNKPKIPIIHRLDGVAKLYGRNDPKADKTQFSISRIADYIIFQSDYSKKCFEDFDINPVNHDVIHNAVDGNIFYPSTKFRILPDEVRMIAISWSDNPMKGFSQLVKFAEIPNIELNFIGNWNSKINSGKVKLLGVKTSQEIAKSLRNSHVLVHLAENDPCPNVIIEGLASGIPIIYKNSGGNSELAKGFGIPISDNLLESYSQLRISYYEIRNKILDSRDKFLIENCAKKYIKTFLKAIELK
jgi:glycosyltransferase involved in cell wall biosynthesis